MNFEFNPQDYYYEGPLGIDANFWAELSNDSPDKFQEEGFRIPSRKLNADWPEILKIKFDIDPNITYDPKVSGLILDITPEMLEAKRKTWYKYVVKNIGTMEPIDPPESITAEQYLDREKSGLMAKISAGNMLSMLGIKKEKEEELKLTDFEERLLRWRNGYGYLIPYAKMSGIFFSTPTSQEAFKYEVTKEYFFHIPDNYHSGIILSLGHEPNSNRCIWGFRRDLATDWPSNFPRKFVESMNFLTGSLESILR